ncbi:hypothetical protein [Lysobacter enzymogenes]|uniref:hypothetical protein n=1 Tax=Lysobacter enzymogenes TaxID=69 RepID=UPI000F4C011E|nr:hypothetical protein [Lysobacter enzymogenes]
MLRRIAVSLLAFVSVAVMADELPRTTWEIDQQVDPMTDVRKCTVRAKDESVSPVFVYRSDAGWLFIISNADFPGRRVRARVDRNAALTGEEDLSSAQDKQLFKQIRAGGLKLLTESLEWPNDYPVVREFALEGLVSKLDDCESWVRRGGLREAPNRDGDNTSVKSVSRLHKFQT